MSKNEETVMDKLTTEMMEHLCDKLCKHPNRVGISQDELDETCASCKMGQYVCGILNEYNCLNDFEKTQSFKLLQNISKLESELQEYKHTNLAPEQILETDRAYREKCEELEKLQKKMPCCNLGDTVWVVSKPDKQIKSGKVFQICYENDIFTYYSDVYGFSNADINVDVFLSENEAEQALKRLESEQK